MFPLAIVLGMAAFAEDRRGALYGLVLALGGGVIALYHTLLVAGWVPKPLLGCWRMNFCPRIKSFHLWKLVCGFLIAMANEKNA